MPPVIANGGYYGAPGVTAAGAYGSTPADMLYSLRNNGWSDQQIMDVYGMNDPMVRIMQLENRWNQTQPGANGYRYQFPQRQPAQRQATGPGMNTLTRTAQRVTSMVPGAQQQTQQQSVQRQTQQPATTPQQPAASTGNQLTPQQRTQLLNQNMMRRSLQNTGVQPTNMALLATPDDYQVPVTNSGLRIRPWTPSITYGGSSLTMPEYDPQYSSLADEDDGGYWAGVRRRLGPAMRRGINGPVEPEPVAQDPRDSSLYNALQRTFTSRWNQIIM